MNRIERISAILVRLQSRPVVTAQEIARQFGISRRTVYRDIRALEDAGIPICGEAGEGYSLADGYKLPPLMFSTDEAIAFLMAEKLIGKLTDSNISKLYQSGMDKIRAVLRSAEKGILCDFDRHIQHIDLRGKTQFQSEPVLHPLLQSISHRKAVDISYTAAYNGQSSNRRIEPLGLFFMVGYWYLIGWCLLRQDYRTFNLERITDLHTTECDFSKCHPDLKELTDRLYGMKTPFRIVIKILAVDVGFIESVKHIHGLTSEKEEGEHIIQTYQTDSLEYFGRWFLSFADKAEIIEPYELKATIKRLLTNIAHFY